VLLQTTTVAGPTNGAEGGQAVTDGVASR
jgi:hypothetical protein